MPNVLFTDRRFARDEVFDTRIFCEPNRRAAEAEGHTRLEVEGFLESMRALMTAEYRDNTGRDLPGRDCAISTVLWPHNLKYKPPRSAGRCYLVSPKGNEATWAVVDEDWVDLLVERWAEAKDTTEAQELAELYWSGTPRHYGPGSSNLLIEGKIVVVSDCPEEDPRLWGIHARPPLRMEKPKRRSEWLATERRRKKSQGVDED